MITRQASLMWRENTRNSPVRKRRRPLPKFSSSESDGEKQGLCQAQRCILSDGNEDTLGSLRYLRPTVPRILCRIGQGSARTVEIPVPKLRPTFGDCHGIWICLVFLTRICYHHFYPCKRFIYSLT